MVDLSFLHEPLFQTDKQKQIKSKQNQNVFRTLFLNAGYLS